MIPEHIMNMAATQAELMRCTVVIYRYKSSYVLLPFGYSIPVEAQMIGYMTKELHYTERNGDEKTDHADTDNNGSE